MEIGDYLLPDNIIIERKRNNDLIGSIMSGRLFEQLNAMPKDHTCVLAIISDNLWKDFYFCRSRNIHSSYIGLLSTLTKSYSNVRTIFLESDEQLCDYIVSLHSKLTKEGESSRPSPTFRFPKSIKERKENALTAAEQVGVKTAKRILKEHNTIANICNLSAEEIQQVTGVKKKQAENIYALLH